MPPTSRPWPCCPGSGPTLYDCPTARADALFELVDALLCADGPVRSLVDLTLTAEYRRVLRWAELRQKGHEFGLADAVNAVLAWRLQCPAILSFDHHYRDVLASPKGPRIAVFPEAPDRARRP
ncbi:hypothetical protein BU198_29245 [Streptomyces sp. CBMA156]|nr:hypothetical protein [Streptomyces sp. CBMA156]